MGSDAFDRPADDPALDRVFDVLADERRRDVLYFLQKGADDTANVETLADHLAGSESSERDDSETAGESDRSETIDEREQTIAIQLSHVHLPKLDAADIVEYEPDSQTVEYEGDETAEALLDATTVEN
jgi:DNA-binding transcriptional ArsR family regulator